MLALAWQGITSLTNNPIGYIVKLGLLISLISGVVLVWSLVEHFRGTTIAGWTSLIVSLWFLGGLILFRSELSGSISARSTWKSSIVRGSSSRISLTAMPARAAVRPVRNEERGTAAERRAVGSRKENRTDSRRIRRRLPVRSGGNGRDRACLAKSAGSRNRVRHRLLSCRRNNGKE